jgi:hypothetical protein
MRKMGVEAGTGRGCSNSWWGKRRKACMALDNKPDYEQFDSRMNFGSMKSFRMGLFEGRSV